MKSAIHRSKSSTELYENIHTAIIYVIGFGYDYEAILKWNIGAFFEILSQIGKVQKAKAGIK